MDLQRYLAHVPTTGSHGLELPVHVHEVTLADEGRERRCGLWQSTVQPSIASEPARPDASWNWPMILRLTLLGGVRRGGRVFQMTVGDERKPAAMIALLENERWFAGRSQPATYLWFLSTAPASCLTYADAQGAPIVPHQIGRAAFDVALTVALNASGAGRLWLHADPGGGDKLIRWYIQTLGMRLIHPLDHPRLPGDVIRGDRRNDGRYLFLDRQDALRTHRAMASYRS